MSDDFDDPDPLATPPPGDEFYVYPRDDRGGPFDDDDDQDRGASSSSFCTAKDVGEYCVRFSPRAKSPTHLVADDGYLPNCLFFFFFSDARSLSLVRIETFFARGQNRT